MHYLFQGLAMPSGGQHNVANGGVLLELERSTKNWTRPIQ